MTKRMNEAISKVKEILLNTVEAKERIERLAKDCERYELNEEWDLLEAASKEIEYISLVMELHWSDKPTKYIFSECLVDRLTAPNPESMKKIAMEAGYSTEWARYHALEYYSYIAEKISEVIS